MTTRVRRWLTTLGLFSQRVGHPLGRHFSTDGETLFFFICRTPLRGVTRLWFIFRYQPYTLLCQEQGQINDEAKYVLNLRSHRTGREVLSKKAFV